MPYNLSPHAVCMRASPHADKMLKYLEKHPNYRTNYKPGEARTHHVDDQDHNRYVYFQTDRISRKFEAHVVIKNKKTKKENRYIAGNVKELHHLLNDSQMKKPSQSRAARKVRGTNSDLQESVLSFRDFLPENAPTNAGGSGNIAGLGVGDQGEPGVNLKRKINVVLTTKSFKRKRAPAERMTADQQSTMMQSQMAHGAFDKW